MLSQNGNSVIITGKAGSAGRQLLRHREEFHIFVKSTLSPIGISFSTENIG